jgi:hypothetical protein
MPVSYVIDKANKLVVATATGVLTADDIWQFRQEVVRDPDFDPNLSQLGVLSDVDRIDLTADEIRVLADTSPFALTARRALVGETPEVYGLARMFEIMRGLRGDHHVRVFHSRAAALEWLLAGSKAA